MTDEDKFWPFWPVDPSLPPINLLDAPNVSRVEVIGPEEREYVRYFKEGEKMYAMLQDDGRTLKIFIGGSK